MFDFKWLEWFFDSTFEAKKHKSFCYTKDTNTYLL